MLRYMAVFAQAVSGSLPENLFVLFVEQGNAVTIECAMEPVRRETCRFVVSMHIPLMSA